MSEGDKGRNLMQLSSVGVEFIMIIALMLAGGFFLDRWLGMLPVFTVWGGVIGFFVALRRLVIQAKQAGRLGKPDQTDREDPEN